MKKKKGRKILEVARALIAKPENWIKYDYACDQRGNVTATYDESSCKFCAQGALLAAVPRAGYDRFSSRGANLGFLLSDKIMKHVGTEWKSLPGWNDRPRTTHADVIAAFDAAIEATRKKRV